MDFELRAKELFKGGYNCAQATLGAFCGILDIDLNTALRITAPFGGGIARTRGVCGAVSGMCMAVGLLYARDDAMLDADAKANVYAVTRALLDAFQALNGSTVCGELLGLSDNSSAVPTARTPEFYHKRPCAELVGDAARLLADRLAEDGLL